MLASVLDLGLYETLQGSAAGHRDHWQSEIVRTDGALAQNRNLLDAIPDPTAELVEIASRLDRIGDEVKVRSAKAEQLREAVARLRQKRQEAETAGRRISVLRTDIDQSEAAASAIAERIANAHALEERAAEICAGASALEAAQTEMERLQAVRAEHDRLRNRRSDLQAAIDRTGAEISAEATQLKQHIDGVLRPAAARADGVSQELLALKEAETALDVERSALELEMAESADLQRDIALGRADLDRCVAEGKELRSNQREMQSADAVCPLCRTPLTEDACGDISAWYEAEIQAKLTRHDAIKRSMHDLSTKLEDLQAGISQREPALSQRQQRLQQQRGRLEQSQRQGEEAASQLETSLPRLERLQLALSENDFAIDQRTELAKVEEASAKLGYDERSLDEAIAKTRSLRHWDSELRRLEDARVRLPGDEASLGQSRHQLTRLNEELQSAGAVLAEAQLAAADLPETEREAADADKAVADLLAERDALLARQGRLHGDADRRASYREEIGALENRRTSSGAEQSVYADLYQAFGRSGVPACSLTPRCPGLKPRRTCCWPG